MKTKTHQDLCWHLPLLVAVFIQLWPIVFMVSTSLKDMDQIFQATLNPLPLPPTLNNYLTVLGNFPLFTYIYNTFFIAAFVTVFKVLTSVLAAFAFIYYDFKYKETVFNSMLLTFFIPITVLIMPNYLLMSRLDLLNTPWGVMLPQFVDGLGVFLMRQAMRGVHKPLLAAADLDNDGRLRWNDYYWPLRVLQDKDSYTQPQALQMFISSEVGSEWCIAMAVATLTSLPPLALYLVCQKFILNTFMQSGVKG